MEHHHGHEHGHHDHTGHHHGHHEHTANITAATSRAFVWSISLNAIYVVVEVLAGLWYDSMGLVSDAVHNLSDVASLAIAWIAFRLSQKTPNRNYTYGYGGATVQASFINALILYVAVGAILVECIHKFTNPAPVDGSAVAWVAGVGVIINGLTAYILIRANSGDLNIKGAYMHMLADTLVSVGVVVSGILIHFTGWYVVDPIMGLLIAAAIAWGSRSLLTESFRLWMGGVPKGIDMTDLEKDLEAIPGVENLHHLHVWALTTTVNAMTAHLQISAASQTADPATLDRVIRQAGEIAAAHGIQHPTVQVETTPAGPADTATLLSPTI